MKIECNFCIKETEFDLSATELRCSHCGRIITKPFVSDDERNRLIKGKVIKQKDFFVDDYILITKYMPNIRKNAAENIMKSIQESREEGELNNNLVEDKPLPFIEDKPVEENDVNKEKKAVQEKIDKMLNKESTSVKSKHLNNAPKNRIYKVVPGPTVMFGTPASACAAYQNLINKEAEDGWIFDSCETITTGETKGCGCLKRLPNQTEYVHSYMLIFYKDE